MSIVLDSAGSLFDCSARALVNPVNCEGVMGKGLALDFKHRFPAVFDDYRLACRRKILAPGQLHTFQLEDGRWIINFPTKDAWRQPSRLAYITAGLPVLVDFVRLNAIESIAIPALGCGLGGLSWSVVRAKIVEAFSEIPTGYVDVKLFPPRDKR